VAESRSEEDKRSRGGDSDVRASGRAHHDNEGDRWLTLRERWCVCM